MKYFLQVPKLFRRDYNPKTFKRILTKYSKDISKSGWFQKVTTALSEEDWLRETSDELLETLTFEELFPPVQIVRPRRGAIGQTSLMGVSDTDIEVANLQEVLDLEQRLRALK